MSTEYLICPVCDEGELATEVYTDQFKHGASTIKVAGLKRCLCPTCGADPVLEEQYKYNAALIADYTKEK